MAKINKPEAVKEQVGLPTLVAALTHKQGDTVPAEIQNQDGTQAPAALTEGEFVFSIPAIIALGEGNYEAGMSMLDQVHTELRTAGEGMMGEGMEQPSQEAPMPPQGLGAMMGPQG